MKKYIAIITEIWFDKTHGNDASKIPLHRLVFDKIIFSDFRISNRMAQEILKLPVDNNLVKLKWTTDYLIYRIKKDVANLRLSPKVKKMIKFLAIQQNIGYNFYDHKEIKFAKQGILVDSNRQINFYKNTSRPQTISQIKNGLWFDGKPYKLDSNHKALLLGIIINECSDLGNLAFYNNVINEIKGGNADKEISLSDVFYQKITNNENKPNARFHLYFYGKARNMTINTMMKNNFKLFLSQSGDVGTENYIDVLSDKCKKVMLYLDEVVFLFNGKIYSNIIGNFMAPIRTDEIVIQEDGQVGIGGTFYPIDIILEPHPDLIIKKDVIIKSPIKSAYKKYYCCHNIM